MRIAVDSLEYSFKETGRFACMKGVTPFFEDRRSGKDDALIANA